MSKKCLVALAAFAVLGASFAQAGPIVTLSPSDALPNGAGPGGTDLYIFNIDPDGEVFDTIDIVFTADAGSTLLGEYVPAVVEFQPAGVGANTDVLGLNTVALGWSILGGTDSPGLFNASGGPLGQKIVAPLDFAQIVANAEDSGTWTVNFANEGVVLDELQATGLWGVPEPATLALFGLGLIGVVATRRR